jgi:hypothetical protein
MRFVLYDKQERTDKDLECGHEQEGGDASE